MTILNDKEIRALCLVPTHHVPSWSSKNLFAETSGGFYSLGYDLLWCNEDFKTRNISLEPLEEKTQLPMISPFEYGQVRQEGERRIISYGTSSMGYDVRLGNKFKIFTNVFNALIDPLDMPEDSYVDWEGDFVIIPPNSYALGHTIEYFNIPEDILAICVGKSTYARAGLSVNVTPVEPGFCGEIVIELANHTPLPMKVHAHQGIAQFLFLQGNPCDVSYAARAGKYQGQTGIRTAIV